MSRAWQVFALAAVLGGGGCIFKNWVNEVKAHSFADGTTLEAAYSELLDNSTWQSVRVENVTYIRVSGVLAGGSQTLEAYYRNATLPPVLVFFTLDGHRYDAAEFARFLSQHLLLRGAAAQL